MHFLRASLSPAIPRLRDETPPRHPLRGPCIRQACPDVHIHVSTSVSPLLAALAGGLLLAGPAPAAAGPAPELGHRWHFAVSLDGHAIGWHDFTVTASPQEVTVDSEAHLRVTALMIPVYRYEHRDYERWRGGCLRQIDARTSEDGHEYIVHGRQDDNAFKVHGPSGPAALQGCVRSFAYWDRQLLQGGRLLNAQTGRYEPVTLTQLPDDPVLVRGRTVPAEHYALEAQAFRVELWYSPQGEWLALASRTAEGRQIRYEIAP